MYVYLDRSIEPTTNLLVDSTSEKKREKETCKNREGAWMLSSKGTLTHIKKIQLHHHDYHSTFIVGFVREI
jgi:hypothetical protein